MAFHTGSSRVRRWMRRTWSKFWRVTLVNKNVRGIRHAVNWHPDPAKTYVNHPDLIRTEAWRRGFGLLRRFNLSFDLQLYPAQMADAAALAHAYPDVLIILDHAGMPVDRDEEGIGLWRSGMQQLAAASNMVVKISGLG